MATTTTRRKVRAVLAGGLVLGVGAAVTLAAWNDSEFATGTFTAGTFNLEGSTDGTTFTDHNVDDGDTAATLAEHVAVFGAIELRDADAAATAMRTHMEAASGRLERSLSEA